MPKMLTEEIMKKDFFLRGMHGLFTVLMYAPAAIVAASLLVIFYLTGSSKPGRKASPPGLRIEYDTSLTNQPYARGYYPAATDNYGNRIEKVIRQDGYLSYFAEGNRIVSTLNIDSLQRQSIAGRTDSALRHQLSDRWNRQTKQIDSIARVMPNLYVVRFPDRFLHTPQLPSGGAFSLTLPVNAQLFEHKGADNVWFGGWQHQVTNQPFVQLQHNQSLKGPYKLSIQLSKWTDITPELRWPVLLMILGVLCYVLSLVIVSYWLKTIFADLLNGHYFGEQITQRVRQIGWVCIGLFGYQNIADWLQPRLAASYLAAHGYVVQGAQMRWPDHWYWLLSGFVFLVFAQIFAYGTQLQQESELTI